MFEWIFPKIEEGTTEADEQFKKVKAVCYYSSVR
jgi:hypothetical protein